ncbi:Ig-like domain-containing protein [Vibrio sp. ZSDZ65]|uniref:Ig-like domain-containing protein n=1 Tax=Vibrio qingdaonensis TaxID=2829491 RepID=A0A9X3CLA5_9VIBR|nr:Ig-like domain-containing protein [Vibrio qingdaonensis]MCW8345508.1 Ig-like domain-containing protein [Vibrio qingdaonensis]
MRKGRHRLLYNSKVISLGLVTLALNGCGTGEEEPSSPQDSIVEVFAQDALLKTEINDSGYIVDLSTIVLANQSDNVFRLSDVSVINSNSSCSPMSIEQQSFTINRKQAKVCDYAYAVIANNQADVNEHSSGMVRVVVSDGDMFQLPALSHVAKINEVNTTTDPDYNYEPIQISLINELSLVGTDVSNWTLSPSITQPYTKGSLVNVDVTNHLIEYIPAPGTSGIDRLMYSYIDDSAGQAYSGVIDIAVAENANQGIELLTPNAIYGLNGKTYVPLKDAINGIEIDVSPYVNSLDGDDIQLIYVKSLTAPQTSIDGANQNNLTNTKFTFKASTQNVHFVTYAVSDHKGSYQIGHISVTVLDENDIAPWVDVTDEQSNTLFYAPKTLNVAIANSYTFDESITTRVSGINYSVAGLYSDSVIEYCSQLSAELATSEELKSLVDRGWLNTALWPQNSEYLVLDRISGDIKILDISAGAYTIDITTLDNPLSDISYYPACVEKSDATDRMLVSLQLSAKLRSGTTSISVPNGKSINTTLTGYFNDGSVENDMLLFDKSLTTFVQSSQLLTQDSFGFIAHTIGNTDLYGQYNANKDPLRSNIIDIEVTTAVVTKGTLSVSSHTVPQGSTITLDGQIEYSDNSSSLVSDEASITWMIDGTEYTGPGSHNYVDDITYDGSNWTLKSSDINQGSFDISWIIDGIWSNLQTVTIVEAALVNLESIVTKDSTSHLVANEFAIGRPFYFTVMGKFTDDVLRDVTSMIEQQNWEYDSSYVNQSSTSFNQFTGHAVNRNTNDCGYGQPIKAWLNGLSICKSVIIAESYLMSLTLTPSHHTLPRGTKVDITATGTYSDGSSQTVNGLECTWTSSNTNRATVDNYGKVTTNSSSQLGDVTIMAVCPARYGTGSVSSSAIISVTGASLVSINASPGSWRMSRLETKALTAIGVYSDGTTADISNTVSWSKTSSGYDSSLTINGAQVTVGIGYTRSGSLDFVAKLNGITSDTVTLTLYNSFYVSGIDMRFTLPSRRKASQEGAKNVCDDPASAQNEDWGDGVWTQLSSSTSDRLYDTGVAKEVHDMFVNRLNDDGDPYGTYYWVWNPVNGKPNYGYKYNMSARSSLAAHKTEWNTYICGQPF